MQTYMNGREDQFRDMMQALAGLEGKYKGVRGQLLAKVKAELAKLKPVGSGLVTVASPQGSRPPEPGPKFPLAGR